MTALWLRVLVFSLYPRLPGPLMSLVERVLCAQPQLALPALVWEPNSACVPSNCAFWKHDSLGNCFVSVLGKASELPPNQRQVVRAGTGDELGPINSSPVPHSYQFCIIEGEVSLKCPCDLEFQTVSSLTLICQTGFLCEALSCGGSKGEPGLQR
jgi:hypothetical protein